MKQEAKIKSRIQELLVKDDFDLQEYLELTTELIQLDTENLRFLTDAGAIPQLGRDSIKDQATAIVELVKNSYDANATKVEIEILARNEKPFIRIADNGIGMSEQEVIKNWLRIGYSDKKNDRSIGKRVKTGEKGIGRLSADRLGGRLKLTTKSEKHPVFGLEVDWDIFEKSEGKALLLVPFKRIKHPTLQIPEGNHTGTELIIESLRSQWTIEEIRKLNFELSILIAPFKGIDDFIIELENDISPLESGVVESNVNIRPEIKIECKYIPQDLTVESDEVGVVEYKISDMYKPSGGRWKKVSWDQLRSYVIDPRNEKFHNALTCGPVELEINFYPRQSFLLKGSKMKLSDLKSYLDDNSGVKIYRDGFRVNPYGMAGKEGEDWLTLGDRKNRSPAGIARPDWRVNQNQLVGAIFIDRLSNPELKDNASREGLIHNSAFHDLRALTLAAMRLLESYRYELYKNQKRGKKQNVKDEKPLDSIINDFSQIKDDLDRVKDSLPEEYYNLFKDFFDRFEETSKSAEATIQEVLDKNRTLGGLATLGISSAVFGHEVETSIAHLKMEIQNTKEFIELNPPEISEGIESIERALQYSDRVSAWGTFALSRLAREKRTKQVLPVDQLVHKIIQEVMPNFQAVGIKLESVLEATEANTFSMDVETILLNLLTNSYTELIQQSDDRRIKVLLESEVLESRDGFTISVSDSGRGVPDENRSIIWEPLWSTKTDHEGNRIGTGLGLSIIQSILDEHTGMKRLTRDSKLGGAKFSVWLPK